MSAEWDIVGLGVVTVDDLVYLDHYPEPDTKMQMQEMRREGGGLTGTALVAAARLGARTAYCGVLGDDDLSRFAIEGLEQEGVDCSHLVRRSGARPYHSLVFVVPSLAQRTILFSNAGAVSLEPSEISERVIAASRVLFVDHSTGAGGLHAARLAHDHGIPVVGDIETDGVEGVLELMAEIDHLIISLGFGQLVTGETEPLDILHALAGPRRACSVVTDGDQGCWYQERGGAIRHHPAFVVEVVDTTGCGDVFHGAYAACLASAKGVPEAIQTATAAAALKATRPGGRSGIPSLEEVSQFVVSGGSGMPAGQIGVGL